MIAEKTITICGKEVQMRYCAASETGYEILSGKSSDVFSPTVVEKNEKGEIVKIEPPKATTDDYIKLAIASIIAAYECNEQEIPVTTKEIMYKADATEVRNLIMSVNELRGIWYNIPKTIPYSEFEETSETDQPKNAQPPANDSKDS
jgi:hypothetical protein